jgi:hypothetical protein
VALYQGSTGEHQDYLQQILNDAPVNKLDSHQNDRESWDRVDTTLPNDWRDCKRYSRIGCLIITGGGPVPARGAAPAARKSSPSRQTTAAQPFQIRQMNRR